MFCLIRYGKDLGAGYSVFLTTSSACLLTTCVLLICYVTSAATYSRVRPSLFEVTVCHLAFFPPCASYSSAMSHPPPPTPVSGPRYLR